MVVGGIHHFQEDPTTVLYCWLLITSTACSISQRYPYTILYHLIPSYTILYRLIPSYTILYHLIPSYTILYHLIPSYTILYHLRPQLCPSSVSIFDRETTIFRETLTGHS